jgi:hypothetical protein
MELSGGEAGWGWRTGGVGDGCLPFVCRGYRAQRRRRRGEHDLWHFSVFSPAILGRPSQCGDAVFRARRTEGRLVSFVASAGLPTLTPTSVSVHSTRRPREEHLGMRVWRGLVHLFVCCLCLHGLLPPGTAARSSTCEQLDVWIYCPCVWLSVFVGACVAGCNELVFDCCQPSSTRARCVFGYLRADMESDSYDT